LKEAFYETPPFYMNYVKKLYSLKKKYPFLHLCEAGRSVQGKKIYSLFLGNICRPVLYAAAFHAQEWLTQLLLIRFIEELCRDTLKKGEICRALSSRGVIFVPCVNPDGVELVLSHGNSAGKLSACVQKISGGDFSDWQANIRGVDINHNFDAGHKILREMEISAGITVPSPRQFGGYYPHSEPESRTMVHLCRRYNVSRVYAFHSQGEEIFYRYGPHIPAGAEAMAKILSQASGYSLPLQSGLASHGGFKDWFILETGKPGFTIEIGRGKNPLPIGELSPIFARLYEMMLLGLVI